MFQASFSYIWLKQDLSLFFSYFFHIFEPRCFTKRKKLAGLTKNAGSLRHICYFFVGVQMQSLVISVNSNQTFSSNGKRPFLQNQRRVLVLD